MAVLPRSIFHDFRGKPGFMMTPMRIEAVHVIADNESR